MSGSKKSKTSNASESRGKKEKTTHFLCFPIATKTTVPLLATSLEYFRSISTKPEKLKRRLEETADGKFRVVNEDATSMLTDIGMNGTGHTLTTSNENGPFGNASNVTGEENTFAKSLQIFPSIVHRAAGTYHLTLGVMDLSEEAQMQKAKDLLESLNLQQILRNAESGPPGRTRQARNRKDKTATDAGGIEDQTLAEAVSKEDNVLVADSTKGVKSLERSVSPPPASMHKAKSTENPPSEETSTLYVSLTGLGAFPKEKAARVIWARPREQAVASNLLDARPVFNNNNRLYNFGLHVREIFRTVGLINETRPLVLHATVANMRYNTQAEGGRTTKGRKWAQGQKRWQEGMVDARPLLRLFNGFNGDMSVAEKTLNVTTEEEKREAGTDQENEGNDEDQKVDARDEHKLNPDKEYIWLRDVPIDRVAICKMGATEAEDPTWGFWYPPISEKMIFDS